MSGRRPPTPSAVAAAVAAVLALTIGGCGSSTTVGGSRTLEVGVDEYRVLPRDVHATAGPLTIVVHNYGRLTHSLVITMGAVQEAATGPISPGQTVDLFATLSAGDYAMSSSILSDAALGAYGTLDVRS